MEHLHEIVKSLPQMPGVYQFINKQNKTIYVGKAKKLRSRVSSYFNKTNYESFKTKVLAKQVVTIKHIVVETEADALLLENNLIKELQPKYNVLLKDDKTFPWICIKNESFPRIFSTRNLVKDGSEYFGPYTSAYMIKILLNMVRQLYQLRTCKFSLDKHNIAKKKYKKCLEYHIGNCKAPCEGSQSEEEYDLALQQIRKILRGNIQEVADHLKEVMKNLAAKYKFEEAEAIKQKILLLENYRSKSTIVSPKLNNIDVFSYVQKDDCMAINFLKVVQGAVNQSHTIELRSKMDESEEDLFLYGVMDIRNKIKSDAKDVIVPLKIHLTIPGINFIVPKMGDKRKLLELSERNAKQFFLQKEKIRDEKDYQNRTDQLMEQAQKDLKLKLPPSHIECFDNSNIQGTNPVAACVVFYNGKPLKKEYRHFNIKTVKGANDFASMQEVVYRRYKRMLEGNRALPNLIVIDGGKGQLSSAVNSLKELGIYDRVAIIGIAKRLEEIYYPGDSVPLYIDKNSTTLKLLQHLRNEAHRFGIGFHRNKRSADMLNSALEGVPGIGPASAEKLIRFFGSVEEIKNSTEKDIATIVGKRLAQNIVGFFKGTN